MYVPKDGATHTGTKLGIHFYHSDQVMKAAIDRGDIQSNNDGDISASESHESVHLSRDSETSDISISNVSRTKHNKDEFCGHKVLSFGTPLDDSELRGSSRLITLESARVCICLATSFLEEGSVQFRGTFFDPLWQRLKEQGVESGLNWRYEPIRNSLSSRNWCFVPPCSRLGAKGEQGKDYYMTEEPVVLSVLKEVESLNKASDSLSGVLADNPKCLSTIIVVLTRAVDDSLEYRGE